MWSVTLYYFSPEGLVEAIGVENAFLLLFLLALFGGTSLFFPFPYYIFTISFGAAGLNPLLLGIAAGSGTLVGDATSYYVARRGGVYLPHAITNRAEAVIQWFINKHPVLFPLAAFAYTSIVPFPDDIIMVPAGLAKYPFRYLAPAVWGGKVVYNTVLGLAGWYGWTLITGLF